MSEEHRETIGHFYRGYPTAVSPNPGARAAVMSLLNRGGFTCDVQGMRHTYSAALSVNLVYYRTSAGLNAINAALRGPRRILPKCQGTNITYKGTGIQKAEEIVRGRIPGARSFAWTKTQARQTRMRKFWAFATVKRFCWDPLVAKGLISRRGARGGAPGRYRLLCPFQGRGKNVPAPAQVRGARGARTAAASRVHLCSQ